MAVDVISFLGIIALIFLLGIFCSALSEWLHLPNVLLLVMAGMLLGTVKTDGLRLIEFPPEFLMAIGILALVMIVFDSSSRLKLWEVSAHSPSSLKLVIGFIIINSLLLTLFTKFFFNVISLPMALLFATLMSGTDPATVLAMLEKERHKVFDVLKLESIINTPFTVLFPFLVLDVMRSLKGASVTGAILTSIMEYGLPFLGQFITGIGSGVVVGIVVFKLMSKHYSERISPMAIFTAALLTYILAEKLGGNGVLAVTVLGLFFGNIVISHKEQLLKVSLFLSSSLEILVFVIVGLIIRVPADMGFLFKSFGLFGIYLLIRCLTLLVTIRKEFKLKEIVFMSINAAKGIAVATVIFALSAMYQDPGSIIFGAPGIDELLNLTLLFLLYSIVVSAVSLIFSNRLMELKPGLKKGLPKPAEEEEV